MRCDEVSTLLETYLDGELPEGRREALEAHVERCEHCTALLQESIRWRKTLRLARVPGAPESLHARVRERLHREAARVTQSRASWGPIPAFLPGLALGLIIGIAVMLTAGVWRGNADASMEELVAAHVRSQMVDHLLDIASSDRHTVRPWFNGRLDFSPPVHDYTQAGFPLLGGRLGYIGKRPVAVLVYRHRQHLINVFVWPENSASSDHKVGHVQGYHLLNWRHEGMAYWMVSDLNAQDLNRLKSLLRGEGEAPG